MLLHGTSSHFVFHNGKQQMCEINLEKEQLRHEKSWSDVTEVKGEKPFCSRNENKKKSVL